MTANTLPLIVHEFSPATVSGVEVWTDLTNRWHSKCTISRGKQYERGQAQAGTMSTTYRNNDGYLTPTYASSPYFGGVVLYTPLRVRAQYPKTANLLWGDQANAGETTPIEPGPVPASLNVSSAFATPQIASSSMPWQGSQVYTVAIPASAADSSALEVDYVPIQSTSSAAPATEYSWSGYVRSVTSGATPQMAAVLKFYNASGTQVGTSTVGTITTLAAGGGTSAYTRLTVSAAPPAGAIYAVAGLYLRGTTPTGAWTLEADGLQFEEGAVPSAWANPGDWYYLFQGVVERWPQAWIDDTSGNYTVVQVTATDCLSQMGREKLNYCYLEYLLALGPRWLFQLNEVSNGYTPPNPPAGVGYEGYVSMVWADTIGLLNPIQAYSNNWVDSSVTPGVQPVSTSPSGSFTGTPGPVLQVSSDPNSPATYAAMLDFAHTNSSHIGPPQGGTGWSVVVAFVATPQTSGTPWNFPTMWGAQASSGTTQTSVYINEAGNLLIGFIENGSGVTLNPSISGTWSDGNWHLACMTLSADGKTMTIMGDTVTPASATGTYNFASGQVYNDETIGCQPGPTAGWNGYLALVSEFSYPLTQSQFNTLYSAWRSSFAGESTGSRIARILEVGGFTFPTSIQAGATPMGAAGDWSSSTAALPFQGQSVLALSQQAVDAEQGQMYASVENEFTFTARTYRSPNPDPRLLTTFGEFADGWLLGDATRSILGSTTVLQGEIPYALPVKIGYDADQAYTVAQITMYNGLPPVVGTAGSTITVENSAAVNGPLGVQLYSQNLNIFNASNATKVAQWIVDNGSVEDLRVQSLTVDLSGFSPTVAANAWPQVLGTDINTCVAVNRRPMGGASLALTQWIEKINWELDPGKPSAKVTYQMSPASKSLG